MKEVVDIQKVGMCPHGNFPGTCEVCRFESKSYLQNYFNAYVDSFRAQLESIASNQTLLEVERDMETRALEIFVSLFAEPAVNILHQRIESEFNCVFLEDILRKYLREFDENRAPDKKPDIQERMLRELTFALKDMPVGTWDTSIAQTAKTRKTNCSGSAALFTIILESIANKTGISVDYVNPYGHALVVAKLSDGRIFYADGRNGVFEDVTNDVNLEDGAHFRVYKLRKQRPDMPFRYLPAAKENWRLIVENYAGNMSALPAAAEGSFDDTLSNTATPDELQKIQSEAIITLSETGITGEAAGELRKVSEYLEGALRNFRRSSDFGAESELWTLIHAGQEHLRAAGERASSIKGLLEHIRANKGELRAFLLGDTDIFSTGDTKVDEDLRKYRDARASTRIILHKTDAEFREEIDSLIEML